MRLIWGVGLWLFCQLAVAVGTGNGLSGQYFTQNGVARAYFTGTYFTRIDPQINFSWAGNSPWPGSVGTEDFSVRWIGEIEFPVSGNYKLRTYSDDGIRLIVNGQTLIDQWNDHSGTNHTTSSISFAAGRYPIQIDFYERGGDAYAQLWWSDSGSSSFSLVPQKYLYAKSTNKALSAESVCGSQTQIDLLFAQDMDPVTATQIGNYQFSPALSVVSAQLLPMARRVRLTTSGWTNLLSYQLSFAGLKAADGSILVPGSVSVTPNYGVVTSGLRGTYFSQNQVQRAYFSGSQVQRIDPSINFNWGGGAPVSGIAADYFSTRWQAYLTPTVSGNYLLYGYSDDGFRISLDDKAVLDDFNDHSAREMVSDSLSLVAGHPYKVTVEFYEHGGDAVAQMSWKPPATAKAVIPASAWSYCQYQPPPVSLNHYQLSHSGSGVNCSPTRVTIQAHNASHQASMPPAGTSLQITARNVSTGSGVGTWSNPDWGSITDLGNGKISLVFDGAHDSISLDYRYGQAGTINFDLTDGIATERSGSASADSPYDPNLVLAGSGFRFVDASGNTLLPNQISARPSSVPIFLQAIRTDTSGSSCSNLFANNTLVVNMASQCVSPANCLADKQVSFSNNGNSFTLTHPQQGGASTTAVSLRFSASGLAQLDNFRYPEAGQISLSASYVSGSTSLTGVSQPITVRPVGFCIDTGVSCSSPYPQCPELSQAGVAFNTQIKAVAWESDSDSDYCTTNAQTLNFAQASVQLSHQLLDPAGGEEGTLDNASFSVSQGKAQVAPSLSEVGVFRLSTLPVNYFNSQIPASSSKPIGRISAHHFSIQNLQLLPGCSSFSYAGLTSVKVGQPLSLSLNLLPQNAQNSVLQNYQNAYARLLPTSDYLQLEPSLALGEFNLATQSIDNYDPANFSLVKGLSFAFFAANAPVSLQAQLKVTDDDDASGTALSAGEEYRLGRLVAESAYGPEDKPLALALQSQYFDGSQYQLNTLDNCTSLNFPATQLDDFKGLTAGMTQAVSRPAGFSGSCRASNGLWSELVAAKASADQACFLALTAPGLNNTGDLRYTSPLPDWLLDNVSHQARAFFGRYRGSDRILLWQEFH